MHAPVGVEPTLLRSQLLIPHLPVSFLQVVKPRILVATHEGVELGFPTLRLAVFERGQTIGIVSALSGPRELTCCLRGGDVRIARRWSIVRVWVQ